MRGEMRAFILLFAWMAGQGTWSTGPLSGWYHNVRNWRRHAPSATPRASTLGRGARSRGWGSAVGRAISDGRRQFSPPSRRAGRVAPSSRQCLLPWLPVPLHTGHRTRGVALTRSHVSFGRLLCIRARAMARCVSARFFFVFLFFVLLCCCGDGTWLANALATGSCALDRLSQATRSSKRRRR